MTLFYIALGGALGTLARYGFAKWMNNQGKPAHYAIFIINSVGALLIGMFATWFNQPQSTVLYRALTSGLLGGFTTFSTLAVQLVLLSNKGARKIAILYAVSMLLSGLLLCILGHVLALWIR